MERLKKISTQVYKTCSKCGQARAALDFYRDASNRYGVESRCKYCSLEKARLNRLSGKALLAVRRYSKTPKGRAKIRAYKQSEKYKEYQRNYQQSDGGTACQYRYRAKPEVRERIRVKAREYVKSGANATYKKKHYYALQLLAGRSCHPDKFYSAYRKLQAFKTAEIVEIKP